jgi:prepilin signal peptidase PulO-like enzyme (type II secretory pathway)
MRWYDERHMEMIAAATWLIPAYAGILGIFVGSFLNVVVDRSFAGDSFVTGRSHCDHCGHTLSPLELVPVLSWLVQGGRSRCCGKRLSVQYPLVEALSAIGAVLVASRLSVPVLSAPSAIAGLQFFLLLAVRLVLFWNALAIFIADAKHQLIPLPSLIIGLLLAVLHAGLVPWTAGVALWPDLLPRLVSAVAGGAVFFALWAGSRGRAMGDGDIYLAVMIGLVAGHPGTVLALYIAFLTGAVWGVILIIGGKKRLKSHVAFGPFLLMGLALSLVFSDGLIAFWRMLWGL